MIDFWKYHNKIEAAIGKACNKNKHMTGKAFSKIIAVTIAECSNDLADQLLKRHPLARRKKMDECWLTIFCISIITTCWSSAVARGKSLDRKRDNKGREGWMSKSNILPTNYEEACKAGLLIASRKLAEEGDLNIDLHLKDCTNKLFPKPKGGKK